MPLSARVRFTMMEFLPPGGSRKNVHSFMAHGCMSSIPTQQGEIVGKVAESKISGVCCQVFHVQSQPGLLSTSFSGLLNVTRVTFTAFLQPQVFTMDNLVDNFETDYSDHNLAC